MFSKDVFIESLGGMLALSTPLLGVVTVAISFVELLLSHAGQQSASNSRTES